MKICVYCKQEREAFPIIREMKSTGQVMPCSSCTSAARRASSFNMSLFDYLRLLRAQDNRCAICRETFLETPHIDHSHSNGHVRGLLCRSCNLGIGLFKDSTDLMQSAIEYVRSRNSDAKMMNDWRSTKRSRKRRASKALIGTINEN